MLPSHRKILSALKEKPLSKEELVKTTGYSYDGIRGRISELRKLGYDIEYMDVPVTITEKKYVLKSDGTDKFLEYIDKHNLYGVHSIGEFARIMKLPEETVKRIIARLFDNPSIRITQVGKNTLFIMKKQ